MKKNEGSYTLNVRVQASESVVFDALTTKIGDWWGDQDRPADGLGKIFTMSWGDPWYQFKVVEYVENVAVSWECIDSKQIIGHLEGVEKEWVGTVLRWRLTKESDGDIALHFIHEGLVPAFICYHFCSNTWDRFITFNLRTYLERQ